MERLPHVLAPEALVLSSFDRAPPTCQILSGFFGYFVQGLLFGVCVGSLLLKWWLEVPRRRFLIFLLDSSKQIFGAGVIHVLNMVCAMIFSRFEAAKADECAWYWINIMIDTTFGVGVCWGLLKVTESLFGYDSGNYGKGSKTGIDWESNPDYTTWAKQIAVWGVIVCLMKCLVVVMMWALAAQWEALAVAATHWISDRNTRLIFVMVVTPTCMNIFQFWVQDSFLKFKKSLQRGSSDNNASAEAAVEGGALAN